MNKEKSKGRKKLTQEQKDLIEEQRNNETQQEKFVRIANPRLKRCLYEMNRLKKMVSQPMYEPSKENAETLIKKITQSANELTTEYQKILDGTLKNKTKTEIEGF